MHEGDVFDDKNIYTTVIITCSISKWPCNWWKFSWTTNLVLVWSFSHFTNIPTFLRSILQTAPTLSSCLRQLQKRIHFKRREECTGRVLIDPKLEIQIFACRKLNYLQKVNGKRTREEVEIHGEKFRRMNTQITSEEVVSWLIWTSSIPSNPLDAKKSNPVDANASNFTLQYESYYIITVYV